MVENVGGDDFGEVRTGNLFVNLVPPSQRKESKRQFEDRVINELANIPDARIHFNRGGNGRDLNIYITGDNPQLVEQSARKLVEEMRHLPTAARCRASTATCRARRSSSARTSTSPPSWASPWPPQRHDPHRDPREILTRTAPSSPSPTARCRSA